MKLYDKLLRGNLVILISKNRIGGHFSIQLPREQGKLSKKPIAKGLSAL